MRKLTGNCLVEGCKGKPITKQLCKAHYMRKWRRGTTNRKNAAPGTGWLVEDGGRRICHNYKISYEHVLIAEKALGKPLPPKAVVHHMNRNRADNHTPFNLIICPDQAYHKLIHKRMEEYEKFGKCFSTGSRRRPGPEECKKLGIVGRRAFSLQELFSK